jgi:D-tyrosyl-tRNA(Tyr) deacylase
VWSGDWNDKEPACASPAVSTGSSSRTARAHTANTELGAEFDIVANVTIAAAHHGPVDDEPDYFVDMQPTVKRNEVKAVVGDSAASPTATDKFKMAEVTIECVYVKHICR